jgi:prophage regulatory protein
MSKMDMQTTDDARLIDVNEVAQRLGVTPRTVWRWVEEGRFPEPLYVSRLRRWHYGEVSSWLLKLKK